MPSGITAILTAYNRPHILEEQLKAVQNQSLPPDDVMLWYNKGESPQYQVEGVKTAICNWNAKYIGRFAYALLAKTPFVAIFDDDTIPGKDWFANCWSVIEWAASCNNPLCILGGAGVLLDGQAYDPCRKIGWSNPNIEIAEVDLVGHAWFFPRILLAALWSDTPISWDNGEDMQFAFLAQKYADAKCYVPPHPPGQKNLWSSIKGHLGVDAVANSANVNQVEHARQRNEIAAECIKKGWKTVKMRNPAPAPVNPDDPDNKIIPFPIQKI